MRFPSENFWLYIILSSTRFLRPKADNNIVDKIQNKSNYKSPESRKIPFKRNEIKFTEIHPMTFFNLVVLKSLGYGIINLSGKQTCVLPAL